MCVKFQPSSSNSFQDMRGVRNLHSGALHPHTPLGAKFSCPERVLGLIYMCVNFSFLPVIVSEIWRGPKFTLVCAADFCPPVKCRGELRDVAWYTFYISYGPNRWYNIGGGILGVGRWNGGYIRNLSLLPFGVPIAPTVLGVGGTHPSQVWYGGRPIIVPWQVFFVFR